MNARMNRLIPIVGGVMLAVAFVVGLRACKQDDAPPPPSPMTQLPQAPAPDVDTPADTVRTLSAQVADLLESTEKLTEENRRLREQATALLDRQQRIDERIRSQVREALAQNQQQAGQLVSALTEKVDRLAIRLQNLPDNGDLIPATGSTGDDTTRLPVGFGAETDPLSDSTSIYWVEPLDAVAGMPGNDAHRLPGTGLGNLIPTSLDGSRIAEHARAMENVVSGNPGAPGSFSIQEAKPEPVYTIPANSTLVGATAWTALIGRIPIGGQVQDPVPFKALIGSANLAANGHEIPGLLGMVVSGYAVGDWTLSCVSGRITSATFIFEDGKIVTFGARTVEPNSVGQGNQNRRNQTELGWISDRFGTQCIVGKRVTNAPQYLTQRVGLATLEAAAAAAAAAQTTTLVSPTGGVASTAVTGDPEEYILGRAASEGVSEISRWLTERMAQSWDAIYVQPGAPIVVHVDVNLPIDRDPDGRMVDHRLAATKRGGAHDYLD